MTEPFHWTERRIAHLVTLIVAGAVVILDIVLLIVYLTKLGPALAPYPAYRVLIPAGILAVFAFALRRFLVQLRLFREDR